MLSAKLTKTITPLIIVLTPMLAQAASIELRSADGKISVAGELIGYDGETLTMETPHGLFHMKADGVICHGADCPADLRAVEPVQSVTVAATNPQSYAIAQSLLNSSTVSSSRTAVVADTAAPAPVMGVPARVTFVPDASPTNGDIVITDVIAHGTATAIGSLQNWMTDKTPSQLLAAKALSVVTSPDTGVDRLTFSQIARIFAGEVVNWSEVGGADLDMTLMMTDEASRLYEDVQAIVMQPARKPMTPAVTTLHSPEQIEKAIKTGTGGISLLPSELTADSHTLGVTDRCGFTTWPTDFTIQSGDYPLILSTLVVYPHQLDTSLIQTTFDKVAVTGSVANAETSPVPSPSHLPEKDKVVRLLDLMEPDLTATERANASDLIAHLIDADQLAMSFADGVLSQTEGAWARAHFVQLREAIAAGTFDGQEIIFVGFAADSDGAAANQQSQAAAESILAAFTAFAPEAATRNAVRLKAIGHGALGKPVCRVTDAAAKTAARIEVWTHPAPVKGMP